MLATTYVDPSLLPMTAPDALTVAVAASRLTKTTSEGGRTAAPAASRVTTVNCTVSPLVSMSTRDADGPTDTEIEVAEDSTATLDLHALTALEVQSVTAKIMRRP